ncbi:mobile element protein, partial [Candidatus Magnetomorum sp. HK-1]
MKRNLSNQMDKQNKIYRISILPPVIVISVPSNIEIRHTIRKIRILGDYQLHGVIIRRIVKKPGYIKPPQFEKELLAYEREGSIRTSQCLNFIYFKKNKQFKANNIEFFFTMIQYYCFIISSYTYLLFF